MRNIEIIIQNEQVQRERMRYAWELVSKALQAGPVLVSLGRLSKSRAQEKRYHAMMVDISKQVEFDGKRFDSEVWKVKLLDQFQHEQMMMGTPLSNPGGVTMSLDGLRVVQIRPESSKFRKKEASDFIEYLFSFGAEYGVEWSDPETQSMYIDYWEREAGGKS